MYTHLDAYTQVTLRKPTFVCIYISIYINMYIYVEIRETFDFQLRLPGSSKLKEIQ